VRTAAFVAGLGLLLVVVDGGFWDPPRRGAPGGFRRFGLAGMLLWGLVMVGGLALAVALIDVVGR
jgi:hypothetical protein